MLKTVNLLSPQDIFDLYGCEYLLNMTILDEEEKSIVEFRVRSIHSSYVHSSRERIKAEAGYLGLDIKDTSIAEMVSKLNKVLDNEIAAQSDNLMHGQGFNLMKVAIQMAAARGDDLKGVDVAKYGLKDKPKIASELSKSKIDSFINRSSSNWKAIAQAYIKLEKAETIQDMILSIDHLNDLQHNSFHLLIDLQTGRMLGNRSQGVMKGKHDEAINTVKEILDIKKNAKDPTDFTNKMSHDIAKMINKMVRR